MEPVKLLASGLTLEESKAKRQEKQTARYRHRLGEYVPSGDSKGLLEALIAISPRKSPTPRKSIASRSTKPRKSIKSSTRGKSIGGTADEYTQEVGKSTSRKSIRAVDSSGKETQAERGEKKASKRSVSKARANNVEDEGESETEPSASRQTNRSTSTAKSKSTKLPKKSVTTKKLGPSKPSLRSTDAGDNLDNEPIARKPTQRKLTKSSAKLPPTQTDGESDDLAIKKTKSTKKVDKGKARATEPPPETSESPGTDVDLEDSRIGPSNMKPLSTEEKSLRDAPPDVYETIELPIISRVVSNRDVFEEKERKPSPKKRGRPGKDDGEEAPLSKRGRVRKVDGGGEDKDSVGSKPRRHAKKSPPKLQSTATKGRTRKKVDPPPDMSDKEKEDNVSPGTKASGSNVRQRQQRELDDGSEGEKQDEPDGNESDSHPNRVRLDSIPPEGIVIRKKNGIVEKLLPPVIKPKRKAFINRGKTRSSRKRAIPAHVLKYIGPTRFGSPLKAEGTDTDDDLNL